MTLYNDEFFLGRSPSSYKSAKAILPIVFEIVSPKSVVDVGCGTGAWLSVVRELGVVDAVGIDGNYVDRKLLMVPPECFVAADLTQQIEMSRKFDLAVCLEVAEHLRAAASETLVKSLVGLSPVVLFSAAIPGQGGLHHVNEQWPPYWENLFAKRGYQLVDCIRSRVWNDPEVDFWYAQNCFLFVRRDQLSASPRLAAEHAQLQVLPRSVVHPGLLRDVTNYKALTPLNLLRLFPASFKRAILRRLSGKPRFQTGSNS
ncbi:MAG TPA: methyltransferase domain-containing protein [Candidatus Acidoferrales bacterium]